MNNRIKLIDIELSKPPAGIEGLEGYITVKGLVRLHGIPLGYIDVPVSNNRCSASALRGAALEKYGDAIIRHYLEMGLAASKSSLELEFSDHLNLPAREEEKPELKVTIAICTRNRVFDLARCLNSLQRQTYPHINIVVVDNAPNNHSTELLIHTTYPSVRYVREPRPGLNWARNRATAEADGDIIAFTDDDVEADPGWVAALANVFAEDPNAMAVTGLTVPNEIETDVQRMFEEYSGFEGSFQRRWVRRQSSSHPGFNDPEEVGNGANMAFRRGIFDKIGYFDPALDVGTVTESGGDIEILSRLVRRGYTLVYEPSALVRHRHRRDYWQLRAQLSAKAAGYFSCLMRSFLDSPSDGPELLRSGFRWMQKRLGRLVSAAWRRDGIRRDLAFVELASAAVGLGRYHKARNHALRIAKEFGDVEYREPMRHHIPEAAGHFVTQSEAVFTMDLSGGVHNLCNLTGYQKARIYTVWKEKLLGTIEISGPAHSLSKLELCDRIVAELGQHLLQPQRRIARNTLWNVALAGVHRHYMPGEQDGFRQDLEALPDHVSVSIVVPTRDRPQALRECLRCLRKQNTPRQVEIIVVDNSPDSETAPAVVAEFPDVLLLRESRQGLSYARNKGVIASTGEIVVTVDDDITMPPDWLEKLVAPFARANIMAVTGNILASELATASQQLFEAVASPEHTPSSFEAGKDWFKSFRAQAVPAWRLGSMANAAFRASIFSHSRVGLFEETLGAGSAAGGGADTYFIYQVLQAGFTVVHEATAYAWHRPCDDLRALKRQVFEQSKGRTAYHLSTLLRDHDLRVIPELLLHTPGEHLRVVAMRLSGRLSAPWWMAVFQMLGTLVAPWALWRSLQRVRREGRSGFYVPVAQRSGGIWESFIADRMRQNLDLYRCA